MEQKIKTSKMIRQRKFLLVLPLLVLPFITMMFWALGGGKTQEVQAQEKKQAGFNIVLPDADVKDNKPMDKMSYYDQARQDSAKFLELIKNDPAYKNLTPSDTEELLPGYEDRLPASVNKKGLNHSIYGSGHYNDPNADKIYSKLAELDKELSKPVSTTTHTNKDDVYENLRNKYSGNTTVNAADVDRLEQMMQTMNKSNDSDTELQQLNGMLEKILDVQHPERVQEKLRQFSETRRGQVFAVSSTMQGNAVSLLDTDRLAENTSNGFYSLADNNVTSDIQNSMQAVIHETQTIVNGSTVKLRLTNDVVINGVHIPKDNFLFGIASLNGERLNIKINSIRYHNSLFPVELSVYDMDGLNGIYIPGAITRDVAKESAERSVQGIGLTSLDPSWQAQAAAAGIETAKTLFSKKVKLIKVTVKAGYRVLLRDEKQKQNETN